MLVNSVSKLLKLASSLLRHGSNGGVILRWYSKLKSKLLKNGWALTSPPPPAPNRNVGLRFSSA